MLTHAASAFGGQVSIADYIQHSATIGPGLDGLFALARSIDRRYESDLAVAEDEYVMVHGRFSGGGRPTKIVVDILRVEHGRLAEHWDVMQAEVTRSESKSGLPMFGDTFPDAGHGSLFRYPESFTKHAARFLSSDSESAAF